MTTLVHILLGALAVTALTAATGYFVAQEFAFMAVDRSRLRARASAGDAGAARTLRITGRTSFMLSGAQLGITVTGLLAGYVAEPMIGAGVSALLGGTGVPVAIGATTGAVLALVFVTVVQMIFGELFPKNLAIARPEFLARRLALSTGLYLTIAGPVIRLFDLSATLLLRAIRVTPVDDVRHAATPRDLQSIVADSRANGDLSRELSTLLERTLDFHEATAGHAMVPRPRVVSVRPDMSVARAVEMMAAGHSRLPVLGTDVDDILGVVRLRDVLDLAERDLSDRAVADLLRPAIVVPGSLPLPGVLDQLRAAHEEFACVVDEYGGLAGVITVEDIAEELVGEIADEHDPLDEAEVRRAADGTWLLPGDLHTDEVARLIGHELPIGDYETVGGLVISELRRLPAPGDHVTVPLPRAFTAQAVEPSWSVVFTVADVERHVPRLVRAALRENALEPAP